MHKCAVAVQWQWALVPKADIIYEMFGHFMN